MLSKILNPVPKEITEMITLFNTIPNDDPDKRSYYNNLMTIIELELEKQKT